MPKIEETVGKMRKSQEGNFVGKRRTRIEIQGMTWRKGKVLKKLGT